MVKFFTSPALKKISNHEGGQKSVPFYTINLTELSEARSCRGIKLFLMRFSEGNIFQISSSSQNHKAVTKNIFESSYIF